MKTTTKKTTLPKKPVTKRDKHFYDLGAEQQAKVFDKMHTATSSIEVDRSWFDEVSRKSLGDYQEPITNGKDYTWHIVAVLVFVAVILVAHPYIMSWVNNN